MAREPVETGKIFSHRLINVLAVMDRFRVEAERKNDLPFANALSQCALNMSGGNLSCPMGKLIVEESARTGKLPKDDLTQPPPSRPEPPAQGRETAANPAEKFSTSKAMEWGNTFFKLWTVLKEDAERDGDNDCLEALGACEDLTRDHRCPVRELIVQNLWYG